jgi:hypothetical protein
MFLYKFFIRVREFHNYANRLNIQSNENNKGIIINQPVLSDKNKIYQNFIENNQQEKKFNVEKKFKNVTIPAHSFNQVNFINIMVLNLKLRSINTIMMQYSSYSDNKYYMLGSQIGVIVKDNHDIHNYKNLFEHFLEMYEILLDRYNLPEPEFLTFKIKTLEVDEMLRKDQLSHIELPKSVFKVTETKKNFNSNILPFTYQEHKMGVLLTGDIRTKFLNELLEQMKGIEKIKSLDKKVVDIIYFLEKVINSEEYRVFLSFNKKYLIVSKFNEKNFYYK